MTLATSYDSQDDVLTVTNSRGQTIYITEANTHPNHQFHIFHDKIYPHWPFTIVTFNELVGFATPELSNAQAVTTPEQYYGKSTGTLWTPVSSIDKATNLTLRDKLYAYIPENIQAFLKRTGRHDKP